MNEFTGSNDLREAITRRNSPDGPLASHIVVALNRMSRNLKELKHLILTRLCLALVDAYTAEELSLLIKKLPLEITWDELPGHTKQSKVRALLEHLDHRRQLDILIDEVNNSRPHVRL